VAPAVNITSIAASIVPGHIMESSYRCYSSEYHWQGLGAAPPHLERAEAVSDRCLPKRDRRFESGALQRRVRRNGRHTTDLLGVVMIFVMQKDE
jgi:hypothetical protein